MGEKKSTNQISVLQNLERKRETLTESNYFQGLNINFCQIKMAEICKTIKLSVTAGDSKQILYFKGFVIKRNIPSVNFF